jgi:hypothetical protein
MAVVQRHVEDGCEHQNKGTDNGYGLDTTADQHNPVWMQGRVARKLDSPKNRRGERR